MIKNLATYFFLIFCAVPTNLMYGQMRNVPQQYASIQDAIDAAVTGDTVLVDTGIYFENVRFKGKSILLSSKYMFEGDTSFISRTVINGSQPVYPDSASCVYFEGGENQNAIIQGFTLTGGEGTIITSVGENPFTFREGGAISIESSSPTIQFNLIRGNYVRNTANLDRVAGGGAIRCRYCDALIQNNVIMDNEGFHNGGIAIYWSSATVRNNIIYQNTLSKEFGGAALLVENNLGTTLIENNTIVGNKSLQSGVSGGIYLKNGDIEALNNIIWGNTQNNTMETGGSGDFGMSYNSSDKPRGDTGDVDESPEFSDHYFQLSGVAAQIDAGKPDPLYNDHPESPALGEARNDIGAYGGPYAAVLPAFIFHDIYLPSSVDFQISYPDSTVTRQLDIKNLGTAKVTIHKIEVDGYDDITIIPADTIHLLPVSDTNIELIWTPEIVEELELDLKIYHDNTALDNPLLVSVTGSSAELPTAIRQQTDNQRELLSVFPNPADREVQINYTVKTAGRHQIILTDITGKTRILIRDEHGEPGSYSLIFNNENLPAGVYFLTLKSENYQITSRLHLR
jgi:hypothetical protein